MLKTDFLSPVLGGSHSENMVLEFLQHGGRHIRVNAWTGSYLCKQDQRAGTAQPVTLNLLPLTFNLLPLTFNL